MSNHWEKKQFASQICLFLERKKWIYSKNFLKNNGISKFFLMLKKRAFFEIYFQTEKNGFFENLQKK